MCAAIEFAHFFSFGDHRAVSGRREKRRNAGAGGAHAFGESALRIQFHLDFVVERELLEKFVGAHIARDQLLDLAIFEQKPDAVAVDAGIIRGDREVPRALFDQCANQVFGNPASAESAHQDRRALPDAADHRFGICNALVHRYPLNRLCSERSV